MIRLPVLTKLEVRNYRLFPGTPIGSGISWAFQPGLSLIAGINGLGKTTLLMMILRSFTGPYDLTGDGAPQTLGVVVPERPVQLKSRGINFFAQRVADSGKDAEVTLSASIGRKDFAVMRRSFLEYVGSKALSLRRAEHPLCVLRLHLQCFHSALATYHHIACRYRGRC